MSIVNDYKDIKRRSTRMDQKAQLDEANSQAEAIETAQIKMDTHRYLAGGLPDANGKP